MYHFARSAAFVLAACSSFSVYADSALTAEGAWARATPPGSVNSAAYATLHNSGDELAKIVAASSPVAETVELHTVMHEGDVAKMRQVPFINVAANGTTVLKPGAYHVMLLDLKQPLAEGETIEVTLELADGEEFALEMPVKKGKAMMHHHGHKKHDKKKHEMDKGEAHMKDMGEKPMDAEAAVEPEATTAN